MTDELNPQESVVEVKPESTPVKNPDKLLELYNAQKVELKELKAFKLAKEEEVSLAEQKRLEEKGQYEALIPKKIEEAVSPLKKEIEKLIKERDDLTARLTHSKTEFESLQTAVRTEKVKDATYTEFLAKDGSPKTSKDVFWKLYGDQVAVDDKGNPSDLESLFTKIKSDEFGASLFTVKVPEGSGTPKQNGTVSKPKEVGPIVITRSEANNVGFLRKSGYTLEQITKGEIIIKD